MEATISESIVIVKWSDTNIVHMASNYYGVFPLHQVTRYSLTEKKRILVKQPHNIKTHNTNMESVDSSDPSVDIMTSVYIASVLEEENGTFLL